LNTYECMYIIQSNLSDDEMDRANQRVTEEIEKRGGVILQRERLGRKRLAYSIRRSDDGAYHLLYFELPPGEIASLRLAYRLHPRLLRMLILRREREEVVRPERRKPGLADEPTGGGEPAPTEETGGTSDEPVAGQAFSEESPAALTDEGPAHEEPDRQE